MINTAGFTQKTHNYKLPAFSSNETEALLARAYASPKSDCSGLRRSPSFSDLMDEFLKTHEPKTHFNDGSRPIAYCFSRDGFRKLLRGRLPKSWCNICVTKPDRAYIFHVARPSLLSRVYKLHHTIRCMRFDESASNLEVLTAALKQAVSLKR